MGTDPQGGGRRRRACSVLTPCIPRTCARSKISEWVGPATGSPRKAFESQLVLLQVTLSYFLFILATTPHRCVSSSGHHNTHSRVRPAS